MMTGSEIIVDAFECDPNRIDCVESVRRVCERIVYDLALTVVGEPQWHQFPEPGGVTGMYLLSESHLTCHTFPELSLATFNLYCCRKRPDWAWSERLLEMIGAQRVNLRSVARGVNTP